MTIIQYLNTIHPLPNEAEELLNSLFEPMELPKGTKINCSEKKFYKIMFVEKGLIRLYHEKESKDVTFLFLDENSFSLPIDSVLFDLPNKYSWHVLEDTSIRLGDFQEIQNLYQLLPFLENITRVNLYNIIKMLSDKLDAIQFQTVEERYHFMIQRYPNILLRAPLGHIASYLGMTQQTLSVIRAKKKLY